MAAPAELKAEALRGLTALESLLDSYRADIAALRAEAVQPIIDRPYSPIEAARYLGVSRDTVYRAIQAGQLKPKRKSVRKKSRYLIEQSALDEYHRQRGLGVGG